MRTFHDTNFYTLPAVRESVMTGTARAVLRESNDIFRTTIGPTTGDRLNARPDLIVARPEGLYCPAGDFHIDPWRPVERAVITHAHADHARSGHRHYLAAEPGVGVLRSRLPGIDLQGAAYGERIVINGVTVSLHPAGHVLGSAQVRVEHGGRVWVESEFGKGCTFFLCLPVRAKGQS